MSRKRFKAEEIVNKLREADVLIAQGRTVTHASKQIGVTDQTYYRWRKEYGGLKTDQSKRMAPRCAHTSLPLRSASSISYSPPAGGPHV